MANEQQRYDMSEKIWTVLEPYLAGRHGPWDRIAAVPLSARARRAHKEGARGFTYENPRVPFPKILLWQHRTENCVQKMTPRGKIKT